MTGEAKTIHRFVRFAGEVVAETLWPTRCVLCDAPGEVLCAACARALPYLDWWRACPRCGAPFGVVQCDLCNEVALGRIGREQLPFSGCCSAMLFDHATGQVVRTFKDAGEQRLAAVLASFMARCLPPWWDFQAVTFVPATKAAVRARGFDHAQLLAQALAGELQASCVPLLARPRTRDQRSLSGRERVANLAGRFQALPGQVPARRVLLVDDVLTTGATLCAATDALLHAGVDEVYCMTFARV